MVVARGGCSREAMDRREVCARMVERGIEMCQQYGRLNEETRVVRDGCQR